MAVPPKYIPIVLGQRLTPREAYTRLGGAIRDDGQDVDCANLLNFLRAACTIPTVGTVPTIQRPPAQVLRVDEALYRHLRTNIVLRDLPSLQESNLLEPSLHVAQAINELVSEQRATRADTLARRLEDASTTPEGKWGPSLEIILRLTHSASAAALPPLWKDLAAATKRFEATAITRSIAATALLMGVAADSAPIVTPSLAAKLVTFNFGHPNSDDLNEGIHPFTVGYRSPTEADHARAQAQQHAMLMEGAAPRLADVIQLASTDKVRLPTTCLQAGITLESYRVLLQACLGADHPLTLEYSTFVRTWPQFAPKFEHQMSSQPLTPVLVIRWVQLRLNVWFTEQAASPLALVTPDLQRLYRDFRLEVPWQPSIPAAFTVRPRPVASTPAGAPTAPRQAATLSTSAATPAQAFVANPSQKPELLPWKDLPGTLRQYLRPPGGTPVPPPKNDAGGEHCLSWHLRGKCNTGCSRAGDHKTPNTGEVTRLVAWCGRVFPTVA
jgi:hypothetical protein